MSTELDLAHPETRGRPRPGRPGQGRRAARPNPEPALPTPPVGDERYAYLKTSQHRWLFLFAALAFTGVAVSLVGLSLRTDATLIFLLPLALMVLEQVVATRTSTYRRRVTLEDHLATVELWSPAAVPSIDVFLPTAGESAAVLANTYRFVSQLDWDGALTVWVLDDAGRPEVALLAEQHGFQYLARPGSAFKKAGNLQYAFERSTGDHVVILDADFVPTSDFLRQLVPYLDDPTVGIVQSPQYFSTDRALGWLQRCAGATQELFFRSIQPSRDAVGAAICVGTSAVYRRDALDAIGGFPQVAHSEDVVTGLRMHSEGFTLQYVPVLVSRGECPADLDSFVSQQYRWCDGSMALVTDRAFHEDESLDLRQRLSYWAGFLYYASTALLAVLAPLPLLVMAVFFARDITVSSVLPLAGVIALWLVVFPLVSHGRWRPEVLRVQLISGFAHLLCISDHLRGRSDEWVPTGGAVRRSRTATRARRIIAPYLLVTQTATVVALLVGTFRVGPQHVWAHVALTGFQLWITVPVIRAAVARNRVGAVAVPQQPAVIPAHTWVAPAAVTPSLRPAATHADAPAFLVGTATGATDVPRLPTPRAIRPGVPVGAPDSSAPRRRTRATA